MPAPDVVREKLDTIADDLAATGTSRRTSVRKLLSWFDFQRRGEWVVYTVRQALKEAGLIGKHAFRKRRPGVRKRSVINAALWNVMSTGLSRYDEDYVASIADHLKDALLELLDNGEFHAAISLSTNDLKSVRTRFRMARRMFEEVLG